MWLGDWKSIIEENNGIFPEFLFFFKSRLLAYLRSVPEYVRMLVGQGERPRAPVQVSMKKLKNLKDAAVTVIRVC